MLAKTDTCSRPGLLTVEDALAVALAAVRRVPRVETIALTHAVGRIAAEDIGAAINLPPFDQSAVDGYGIRHDDLLTAAAHPFRQAGTTFAGALWTVRPAPGETVRLLTGAPIPPEIDAVVMEEKVGIVGSEVAFERLVESGLNIRKRGEDVGAGSTIVERGTIIDARHIAILAATGVAAVKVRRRIEVGILSTGSELVPAGRPLDLHQIHDSNGPMLAALLANQALRVTPLGRCRDDRDRLGRRLAQMARSYDLLVCSGGVSGSDADHIVAATLDAGGTCAKLSLALKPGKPLAVGNIGTMALLALPGNPFASLVGALLFARPMLRCLSGTESAGPQPIVGRTEEKFSHRPGRREFVPVRATGTADCGAPLLEKLGRGGSARLWPLMIADGLASIPAEADDLSPGSRIDYYPFDAVFRL